MRISDWSSDVCSSDLRDVAFVRRDQNDAVGQQIGARRRLDQVALGQIIHPADIRRYENVRRCAALDLPGQRRAAGVGYPGRLAVVLPPLGIDILQGVPEARRREDQNISILRGSRECSAKADHYAQGQETERSEEHTSELQ